MRSKRLRRFRRQFPVAFFLVKLVLIWYLVVFSVSYLTSGTAAHFYDTGEAESKVHAGYWADGWDGSSLSFIENGNTNVKACEPVEIAKEIQNMGDGDMMAGSAYDVYYIENGNPEKHGEKLDLPEGEGKIPVLESNESIELKHFAQQPGVYALLAHQPDGHPGEESIWSKWVIVNCPPGQTGQDAEKETQEAEEGQSENTESNEVNETEVPKEEEIIEEESEHGTETSEDEGELTETEEKETEEAGEDS
jgi:TasA anchoring/assembly protein